VSFSVATGEIFGYLGPNGAGKTTTVNILGGLLTFDAGEVEVCGIAIDRDPVAVKRRIGVVPEESNLYPELACRRNLEYLGELYGLSRFQRREKAAELLRIFQLEGKAAAPFGTLSRGMKRRLTVAAALIHSPDVVFLDEPTAGLDVPSARALRSLIRAINREGATVFLTTHNLAEAESLCDRVLILVKGRVLAEGTAAEVQERAEEAKVLSVILTGDVEAEGLRTACPAVVSAEPADGTWRLEVKDTHAALSQLLSFAEREDMRILEIASAPPGLEDAFMTILEDRPAGRGSGDDEVVQ
jgi:ABC-2 type transport system ATP-binding protein